MNIFTKRLIYILGTCLALTCNLACSPSNDGDHKPKAPFPSDQFEKKFFNGVNDDGATVSQTWFGLTIDCETMDGVIGGCANVPNPSLIYQSYYAPCHPDGCTKADYMAMPWGSTYSWSLSSQEAMVMVVTDTPPSDVYWSYQAFMYERHESHIPNPEGYVPPKIGEIIDPASQPDRVVVHATLGDTFNMINTTVADNPNDAGKENPRQTFAMIISPNKVVLDKAVEQMVKAGYPREAIHTRGVPESWVMNNEDTDDNLQVFTRIGHPFDASKMRNWIAKAPNVSYRITYLDEQEVVTYTDYPQTTDPSTGEKELIDAAAEASYQKLKDGIKAKFGEPDKVIIPTGRTYSPQFCVETGSYCWGFNTDALYININDPDTGQQALFDVTKSDTARVVFAGIEHVGTGFTKLWNLGLFAEAGFLRNYVLFTDIQEKDYDFDTGNSIDEHLYWLQIKTKCIDKDEHCIETNLTEEDGNLFQLINRNYLHPTTGTTPDFNEIASPVIYVYE